MSLKDKQTAQEEYQLFLSVPLFETNEQEIKVTLAINDSTEDID